MIAVYGQVRTAAPCFSSLEQTTIAELSAVVPFHCDGSLLVWVELPANTARLTPFRMRGARLNLAGVEQYSPEVTSPRTRSSSALICACRISWSAFFTPAWARTVCSACGYRCASNAYVLRAP